MSWDFVNHHMVSPFCNRVCLPLSLAIQQEGDSLGAMEKVCRQLTYHLSPHSRWRRQGLLKRKPQAWWVSVCACVCLTTVQYVPLSVSPVCHHLLLLWTPWKNPLMSLSRYFLTLSWTQLESTPDSASFFPTFCVSLCLFCSVVIIKMFVRVTIAWIAFFILCYFVWILQCDIQTLPRINVAWLVCECAAVSLFTLHCCSIAFIIGTSFEGLQPNEDGDLHTYTSVCHNMRISHKKKP